MSGGVSLKSPPLVEAAHPSCLILVFSLNSVAWITVEPTRAYRYNLEFAIHPRFSIKTVIEP